MRRARAILRGRIVSAERPPKPRRAGQAEEILLYPHPKIRITKTKSGSTVTTRVNTLHADGLGSIRAVTDAAGLKAETSTYRPYGEEGEVIHGLGTPKETKGFIGERFDADAGLQYLNARYYDPKLGMFLQPDWWEVMQEGVGTNRYSYSFNDPVNGRDPSGHFVFLSAIPAIEALCAGGGCAALGAAIAGVIAGDYAIDATDGVIDGTSPLGNAPGVAAVKALEMVAGIGHNGGPPLGPVDETPPSDPNGPPPPHSTGAVLAGAAAMVGAKTFEKEISKLPAGERVARIKETTRTVAEARGWERATNIEKKNDLRTVYRDPVTGDLYSVDTQHGRFEHLNKRGKHIEELDIEGNRIEDSQDKTGRHDLKVK